MRINDEERTHSCFMHRSTYISTAVSTNNAAPQTPQTRFPSRFPSHVFIMLSCSHLCALSLLHTLVRSRHLSPSSPHPFSSVALCRPLSPSVSDGERSITRIRTYSQISLNTFAFLRPSCRSSTRSSRAYGACWYVHTLKPPQPGKDTSPRALDLQTAPMCRCARL